MNEWRNKGDSVTEGLPAGFTLLSRHGLIAGVYRTAQEARAAAERIFPGEEQDEDREGSGWDLEVIRS